MGYGSWDADVYRTYAYSTGRSVTSTGNLDCTYTHQDLFVSKKIDPKLVPFDVMRECNDSDERPETVPVILALDVTGSMGSAAAKYAKENGKTIAVNEMIFGSSKEKVSKIIETLGMPTPPRQVTKDDDINLLHF